MKAHVDEVAATSVTVSFTAQTPSNVSGYIVGAVVSVGDPMVDADSEDGFGEMVKAKPGRSDYKITVDGLKPETKYNVRAYILAGFGGLATWGDMKSFMTQSPSKPKFLSSEVTKVSTTSVTMVVDWSDNASEIT